MDQVGQRQETLIMQDKLLEAAVPSNADGIAMGGYDSSYRAYVETWNGSTWTETTDLNAGNRI